MTWRDIGALTAFLLAIFVTFHQYSYTEYGWKWSDLFDLTTLHHEHLAVFFLVLGILLKKY